MYSGISPYYHVMDVISELLNNSFKSYHCRFTDRWQIWRLCTVAK